MKLLGMLLGLIVMKSNDVIIWITSSWFLNALLDQQTLEMISQVESFLCPNKQGSLKESRGIQWLKCCVSTNNNKDEENSPKSHTQNNSHEASSKKYSDRWFQNAL